MRLYTTMAGLAALLFAGSASAAGIAIDPGQWEMTTTMTMSMLPEPQIETALECIEEDILDPETYDMEEDNPCSIGDVVIDGNTAHWSINCPAENGQVMNGQWEVTSHGDTLTGKGAMSAEFSGQKMSFDMAWTGKRIGDCK